LGGGWGRRRVDGRPPTARYGSGPRDFVFVLGFEVERCSWIADASSQSGSMVSGALADVRDSGLVSLA
jgi:hypothetical protein